VQTEIVIPAGKPYDFISTLRSHGWVSLLPNTPDENLSAFSRVERLSSGLVASLEVSAGPGKEPRIFINARIRKRLSKNEISEITKRVSYMLRLDENLQPFYAICKKRGGPWIRFSAGSGYLLRSPAVFEDLVKVICTINIQWGGTKRMVRELVEAFGSPFPPDASLRAFPTPKEIAAVSEKEFNRRVKLGYRSGYVYELSSRIARGELDIGVFMEQAASTEEIKKRLLAVKGVGKYAAASMLMLLGRYDQIPVDTVFRAFMKAKYFQNEDYDEGKALSKYDEWGKWKYLAYWNEMLTHYSQKVEKL